MLCDSTVFLFLSFGLGLLGLHVIFDWAGANYASFFGREQVSVQREPARLLCWRRVGHVGVLLLSSLADGQLLSISGPGEAANFYKRQRVKCLEVLSMCVSDMCVSEVTSRWSNKGSLVHAGTCESIPR